ncbi:MULTISPECIES: PaaI family thioesterase [unclassified Xanthobacter]|uniref:PaaI family thioesterase n=1 Tax=unclassified Xanthobacter TaxID=2623496 RepID=UPI001EDE4BA2|nr:MULTISPECIES: PaaI family thioesterase [unclassified Xanthobacter]
MTGMDAGVAQAAMSQAAMERFLHVEFPQAFGPGRAHHIERVGTDLVTVRLDAADEHLRPGGTVSGPALMALADIAVYVALLARIGPVALAVTTSLNINFLRKPEPGAIFADARLIKLGKRLAVGDVGIRGASDRDLVAHCVATYSIPERRAKV